jgi:hypothetical protein
MMLHIDTGLICIRVIHLVGIFSARGKTLLALAVDFERGKSRLVLLQVGIMGSRASWCSA